MSSRPFNTIAQRVVARGRKVGSGNKRTKDDSSPNSPITTRGSRSDGVLPKSNITTRSSKNAGVGTPGNVSTKSTSPAAILINLNNATRKRTSPMKTRSASANLKLNSIASDKNLTTGTTIETNSPQSHPAKRQRQDKSLPMFFIVLDEVPGDTERESSVVNSKLSQYKNGVTDSVHTSKEVEDRSDTIMEEATGVITKPNEVTTNCLTNTESNDSVDAKIDDSGDVIMLDSLEEETDDSVLRSKCDQVGAITNGSNGMVADSSPDKPTDNSEVESKSNSVDVSKEELLEKVTVRETADKPPDSSEALKNHSTVQHSSNKYTDDLEVPKGSTTDTAADSPMKEPLSASKDEPDTKDSLGTNDSRDEMTKDSGSATIDGSIDAINLEGVLESDPKDVKIGDESVTCGSTDVVRDNSEDDGSSSKPSVEMVCGRNQDESEDWKGSINSALSSSDPVHQDKLVEQIQNREEKDVSNNLVKVNDSSTDLVKPDAAGVTFIDLTSDDEKDDVITVISWSSMDANVDEDDPPSLDDLAVFDDISAEADEHVHCYF